MNNLVAEVQRYHNGTAAHVVAHDGQGKEGGGVGKKGPQIGTNGKQFERDSSSVQTQFPNNSL